MQAIVVYESHYGNTEAVARAIAEGLGDGARVMTTDEATPDVVAGVDLVIAGSPVMALRLPTDSMIETTTKDDRAPRPADTTHPSLRAWLEQLPAGHGRSASFETKLRWSPGGATGAIDSEFRRHGFKPAMKSQKFYVKSPYGPLREGELDRARMFGADLAVSMR
jgi:hypothetical protein